MNDKKGKASCSLLSTFYLSSTANKFAVCMDINMKQKWKLSSSMKNVARISTGTIIGQLVSIAALPFITRIYGAEIMGIWATIFAMASLINTVSDLGLIQSIMIRSEKELQDIYSVISIFILGISILASGLVFLYCFFILKYPMNMTKTIAGFSLIYAVTLQKVQISYTWLNKKKCYSVLMKNPLINQIAMAFFSIVFGIFGYKTYGYYMGVTIGQIITLLHMRPHLPHHTGIINGNKIKNVFRQNREFLYYQMPTNITLQIREQLPNLLISALFGNTMLGYFSLSQKLLNIPITFVGQSLGKVFYQRLSEMQEKGQNLSEFIYRNLSRAMKLAFIPMALLAAFGDVAVVMFFGNEYAFGGVIVRIIVFRSLFVLISTSTQGMDIVLRKQKYVMITCLLQTLLISLSIIVSYYTTKNILVCAIMITICFIVIQIAYFCVIVNVLNMPVVRYLKGISISLLAVLALSIVLRVTFVFITNITGWELLKFISSFMIGK